VVSSDALARLVVRALVLRAEDAHRAEAAGVAVSTYECRLWLDENAALCARVLFVSVCGIVAAGLVWLSPSVFVVGGCH
jgi:hypothetical protein